MNPETGSNPHCHDTLPTTGKGCTFCRNAIIFLHCCFHGVACLANSIRCKDPHCHWNVWFKASPMTVSAPRQRRHLLPRCKDDLEHGARGAFPGGPVLSCSFQPDHLRNGFKSEAELVFLESFLGRCWLEIGFARYHESRNRVESTLS